ncbi:hypothetical protein HanPSC8_Chr14g0628601 [Helianthus annuus]|nr:hypothetical protein HanIR_Chr14g0711431 [Helianthus annuus]KAJ0841278.1 hypothetical protein HanPSC8_Chr14g0628601 [Helianthus annuus]
MWALLVVCLLGSKRRIRDFQILCTWVELWALDLGSVSPLVSLLRQQRIWMISFLALVGHKINMVCSKSETFIVLSLLKWCWLIGEFWCSRQKLGSSGKTALEWQRYNGNNGIVLNWEDWNLHVCTKEVMRQLKSMWKGSRSYQNCLLFF